MRGKGNGLFISKSLRLLSYLYLKPPWIVFSSEPVKQRKMFNGSIRDLVLFRKAIYNFSVKPFFIDFFQEIEIQINRISVKAVAKPKYSRFFSDSDLK